LGLDETSADLRRVFEDHPLRQSRILERLRRDGVDLEHLRERDLAEDPRSGITDQNHIGGRTLAVALAVRAGLSRMRVLDLCAGLGGTARVLAEEFGCSVVAIDFAAARCRDALSLNRRVGLGESVHVVQGDARALPLRHGCFDAVVGQSAWSHIRDKRDLLAEAARVLRAGGVVAFEDAVPGPEADAHGRALAQVEAYWHFHLLEVPGWCGHLEACGLDVRSVEDLTPELAHEAHRILDYTRRQYPPEEGSHRAQWAEIARLAEAGALGYVRFVARRGA
jgi:SAM-dependent methyltransferase